MNFLRARIISNSIKNDADVSGIANMNLTEINKEIHIE